MQLTALLFDGEHAQGKNVSLSRTEDSLQVSAEGDVYCYALDQIHLRPVVGKIPLRVELPDGALLEIADQVAASTFFKQQSGWLLWLESRWRYAFLSLLLSLTVVVSVWYWGIPWAADRASHAVPIAWEQKLGEQTLALLDEHWFKPSELSAERQQQIRQLLAQKGDVPAGCCQLVFRRGMAVGANALALPGGTLLVTDELVGLSRRDEEVLAVLMHEVGHIEGRHGLRMVLRASGGGVLAALLVGDVGTLNNFLVAAPALMLQLSYSREFEREADAAALRKLGRVKIASCHFTSILERISSHSAQGENIPRWLATHPETAERTRVFGKACQN